MSKLSAEHTKRLSERIAERKQLLLEDVRRVLQRAGTEHYADLVGEAGDAGDEAAASLLRDVSEAEIVRDVGELRDIASAEARLATGRYGLCVDCGEAIGWKRLDAYPTAKRCIECQQRREKTRAPSKYTGR